MSRDIDTCVTPKVDVKVIAEGDFKLPLRAAHVSKDHSTMWAITQLRRKFEKKGWVVETKFDNYLTYPWEMYLYENGVHVATAMIRANGWWDQNRWK